MAGPVKRTKTRKRQKEIRSRGQSLAILFTVVAASIVSVVYVDLRSIALDEEGSGGPMVADFSLRTIEGRTFRLSDQRGKVVVVDIMMVDCKACRYQSENLSLLQDMFGTGDDAPVIVSIDIFRYDTEARLLQYKNETKGNWPHALDTSEEAQLSLIPEMIDPDLLISLPIVKVIDRSGRIFASFEGTTTAEVLAEIVEAAQ